MIDDNDIWILSQWLLAVSSTDTKNGSKIIDIQVLLLGGKKHFYFSLLTTVY